MAPYHIYRKGHVFWNVESYRLTKNLIKFVHNGINGSIPRDGARMVETEAIVTMDSPEYKEICNKFSPFGK